MEESHNLPETPNASTNPHFPSIPHPLVRKSSDFATIMAKTERNPAFADETEYSQESTPMYGPFLHTRSSFEYGNLPVDRNLIQGSLLINGASATQSKLTPRIENPKSSREGLESTRTNIEPNATRHRRGDKSRKRTRDPTRAILPGPNRYGRRGTLRCQRCRGWRLKVNSTWTKSDYSVFLTLAT
jgi:hypothetical protein